jgi:hypothetical protein
LPKFWYSLLEIPGGIEDPGGLTPNGKKNVSVTDTPNQPNHVCVTYYTQNLNLKKNCIALYPMSSIHDSRTIHKPRLHNEFRKSRISYCILWVHFTIQERYTSQGYTKNLESQERPNKHVERNKQKPAHDRSSIGRWTILQNFSRLELKRTFVSNSVATPISIWLCRMVVRQIYANITFTRHWSSLFMHLTYSYNLITLSTKCR